MAKYADIESMCDRIQGDLHKIAEETLELMNRETEKHMDLAYIEFGDYQRRTIREIFANAVQTFYDAYTPAYYNRSEGLFDVLDIHENADGTVAYDTVDNLLDPSAMHKDRKGGDLYNKVFVKGWHGGAESGRYIPKRNTSDKKTTKRTKQGMSSMNSIQHPSPGTPYYRTPETIYSYWGKRAVRTTSPYDLFKNELHTAEGGYIFAEFKRISDKYNELAMESVQNKLNSIMSKYYG